MKHQDDFQDELLSGYLDGELTADEQGRVEHALAENAELRQTYEELRALRGTLQALPRYSLGDDFTERVVRRLEREKAAPSGRVSPAVPPSQRANSWRTYTWWGSAGVAAALAIAFLINSRPGDTPDVVNVPSGPEKAIASLAENKTPAPATIVEPEAKPNTPTAPLVHIGGSQTNEPGIVEKTPNRTPSVAAVARVVRRNSAEIEAPTDNQRERLPGSDLLVLEVDAAPAPNRALVLAAALSASKIRLESPLRVGPSGAAGEDRENVAASKSTGAAKVEYFVIEGERANVEALVAQLRGKTQAFPRVENPTSLAEAIDRLAALDQAEFGQFLPDVNRPAAASVNVGGHSKAVGLAASPENKAQAATVPGAAPASVPTASLPQARAYRIASPAELLTAEKSPAGENAMRVLLIVQSLGADAENAKE